MVKVAGLDKFNTLRAAFTLHTVQRWLGNMSCRILNYVRVESILGSIICSGANAVVCCKAAAIDIADAKLLELLYKTKIFSQVYGAETGISLDPLEAALEHLDVSWVDD